MQPSRRKNIGNSRTVIQGRNSGTRITRQKTPNTRSGGLTRDGISEVHDTKHVPTGGGRNREILQSVNEVNNVPIRYASTWNPPKQHEGV